MPFLNSEQARLEAKREAEGRAVGSGCRYSGRALEECYGMNPKMSKAAMLAGWRDMDGYMRENNIQVVSPEAAEPPQKSAEPAAKAAEAPAADEKPKAAEAPPAEEKSKSAEASKDATDKSGGRTRKPSRRVA